MSNEEVQPYLKNYPFFLRLFNRVIINWRDHVEVEVAIHVYSFFKVIIEFIGLTYKWVLKLLETTITSLCRVSLKGKAHVLSFSLFFRTFLLH